MNSKIQLGFLILCFVAICSYAEDKTPKYDKNVYTRKEGYNQGRPDIIYPKEAYLDGEIYLTDDKDKTKMPKVGQTCNFMHTLLQDGNPMRDKIKVNGPDGNETKEVKEYFKDDAPIIPFWLFERGCDDTAYPGEIKCDFVFDMAGRPIVLNDRTFTVTNYDGLGKKEADGTFTRFDKPVPSVKTYLYYKKCYCPFQTLDKPPLRLYYSEWTGSKYEPTCSTAPPEIPGLDNALKGKAVDAKCEKHK